MLADPGARFKPERPPGGVASVAVQSTRSRHFAFAQSSLGWHIGMIGLLPLIFALLVAETTADAHPLMPLRGTWTLPLAILAGIVLWALVNELAGRIIAHIGRRRLLGRWAEKVKVACSLAASRETVAVCRLPAAVTVTDWKAISAEFRVIWVAGSARVTSMDSTPVSVAALRSGVRVRV